MGQGQSEIAVRLLHECAKAGHWLCLKNLHLVTAWLPTLEKELNNLHPHDNFRLWLTAEPHLKFTPILLQTSLKVTYEVRVLSEAVLASSLVSCFQCYIHRNGICPGIVLFKPAFRLEQ